MITRSRLEQIEDYHFAVGKLIHKGKSVEEVTEQLKKRGADSSSITATLNSIDEAFQGSRRFEVGKGVRFVNCIIDTVLISLVLVLMYPLLAQYGETLLAIVYLFLFTSYYMLFELLLSRTPGKFITGTVVVDKEGNKLTFFKILIRTLLRLFPVTVNTAVFYDKILHDKWSDTYVVSKKRLKAAYQDHASVSSV